MQKSIVNKEEILWKEYECIKGIRINRNIAETILEYHAKKLCILLPHNLLMNNLKMVK